MFVLNRCSIVAALALVTLIGCETPPVPPPPDDMDEGVGPLVRVIDSMTEQTHMSFLAFDSSFRGGVRVAAGDVNGDGTVDIIVAAGPGAGPHVKVFSGVDQSLLHSFNAYGPEFGGGVYVAAGDVNGDGRADIITGAGAGGGPHVKVFDGANGSLLASFFAFAPSFVGGVRVAAGDVDDDGMADIITGAGPGAGPHVRVFAGSDLAILHSFFAFGQSFTGGVFVAAGDLNGDGGADLIVGADAGGGPQVKVFDGLRGSLLTSFFAFDTAFGGGVRVAAGDVNGDGTADIVVGAGAGGTGGHVRVFGGTDQMILQDFFAFDPMFAGGVFVAAGDVNGDGRADVIVGADAEADGM
ncbi:MAG TPA: VCBS repeat-containing protein [Phycisphaerae bacterium]|nr:VCBS repeat-containing protein [Phycisphaerae bacterium]